MPPTHVEFAVTHPASIGQLLHVDPSPRALKWMRVLVVTLTATAVTAAVSATLQWPSFIAGLDLVVAGFSAAMAIYSVVYVWRISERVARMPLHA